jgi:hypothetical protein
MTDDELAEWKQFGDAIFGKEPRRTKAHCENEYDLFEFFMDANKEVPRTELLKRCANAGRDIEKLNDEDLLMLYCEALVSSAAGLGRTAPPQSPPQIQGPGWLLKAVLSNGEIQLWDIFINGQWVGSKRTEKQCYEVVRNAGLSPIVEQQ